MFSQFPFLSKENTQNIEAITSLILRYDILHRVELREAFSSTVVTGNKSGSAYGLNRGCWEVIISLCKAHLTVSKIVISDLGLISGLSETTVRRRLRTLEKLALVTTRIDENDRRRQFVNLSKTSQKILTDFVTKCAEEFKDLISLYESPDRIRAKKAMRSQDELLTSIMSAARDSIIVMDNEGNIVFVNSAIEKMFGYEKQELIGRPLHMMISPERYYKSFQKGFPKFRNTGTGNLIGKTLELPALRKDGTEFNADHSFSATWINGKWHAIAIIRDTGARSDYEKSLSAAKSKAEDSSQIKSEFVANLSHELRTPLTAIIGFSELILRETFGKINDPHYNQYIHDINESAHHLLQMINKLLDIAKIEAGKMEIFEENVKVHDIIEFCMTISNPLATSRNIELKHSIQKPMPIIFGDTNILRQMLLNLVSNAVKFTHKNGRVSIWANTDNEGKILLGVSDNGPGIAPSDIKTVLKPYTQLSDILTKTQSGTGLGIPLSKMMAELHGGEFKIKSEPGAGTIVTITLPKNRTLPSG